MGPLSLLSSHFRPTLHAPSAATAYLFIGDAFIPPLVLFFAAQSAVFYAAPGLFSCAFPAAPRLDARTSRALSSFVASVLHHLIVVPLSASALVQFASGGGVAWATIALVCPLTLAYLLMDLALFAIPEALEAAAWMAAAWARPVRGGAPESATARPRGSVTYLLHHALGVAVVAGVLSLPPRLLRWAPTLLVTEASSIPLCLSYVLRKAGPPHAAGLLPRALEAAFALSFFATRVALLGVGAAAFSLAGAHAGDRALVGWRGLAVLWALVGMQLYWFWGIVRMLRGRAAR